MPQSQRHEIDRYFLQFGASLQTSNKLSPEELALVKKAALRYRRSPEALLNPNQLTPFLTKIDASFKPPPRRTARSSQYRPGANPYRLPPKLTERVQALLAENKLDEATTLTLRHLHSSYRLRRDFQSSDAQKLLALVQRNPTFERTLLTSVETNKQKSFQARLFASELYSTLEDKAKALTILRELAQTRPHDRMVSHRIEYFEKTIALNELLAHPDRELTLAELTPLMSFAHNNQDSGNNTSTQKGRLPTYLAISTRTLNATEPQNLHNNDLNWPLRLLRQSIGPVYFTDFAKRSPSLVTEGQNFDPERIRLIRDYLAACLRHPQFAGKAFQIATGCQAPLGYTPGELNQLALAALPVSSRLTTSKEKENEQAQDISHLTQYNEPATPEIGPTLQSFLSSYVIQNRLPTDSPEFQALTTAYPQLADQTRRASQIASEDLSIAQAALISWEKVLDEAPHADSPSKLRHFAVLLKDLAAIPETPPIFESFQQQYLTLAIDNWRKSNYHYSALLTPSFKSYLASLWNPKKPELLHDVLAELLSQSLGHSSLWSDYLTLARKNQLPVPLQPLSLSYRQITSDLLALQKDFQILPTLFSLPPLVATLRSSSYRGSFQKYYFYKTEEEAWEAFERFNLNRFSWQTLAFVPSGEERTFFYSLYNHFNSGSKIKKHLLAKLAAQDNPTLKELLFSYQLSQNNESAERLLVHLEHNAEIILALPDADQEAIDSLLQFPFPLGENPPTHAPVPNAILLLQTLNKDRREQLYARLQHLLTEGFTQEDFSKRSRTTQQEVTQLVNLSLVEKPSLASLLTNSYLSSYWKTLKSTEPQQADRKLSDTHHALLRDVLTENRPFIAYLPYLVALEANPFSGQLPLVDSSSPAKRSFTTHIRSVPDPKERSPLPLTQWDLLALLPQPHSSQDQKIASYYFLTLHRSRVSRNASEYWQWAVDSGFQERHPRLCEDLLLNLASIRWGDFSTEQQETLLQIWRDRLSDSSVSLRIRMSLVTQFAKQSLSFSEEPAALIATLPIAREWLAQRQTSFNEDLLRLLDRYQYLTDSKQSDELNTFLRELLQKVTSDSYLSVLENAMLQSKYLEALAPLFLQLQDRESFQTLSQSLGQSLTGKPEILFLLAKMDDRQSINHLLAREDTPYQSFRKRWNTATAGEVAHLLSLIDEPQKRYRLECHLASVNDDTRAENQSFEKRPQRLLRLASKFEELAPPVPTARLECLAKLASPFDLARARLLETPLSEVHQRWPFHRIYQNPRALPSNSLPTLLETYLRLRLAQDDFSPAITASKTLLSRIHHNRSSNDEREVLATILPAASSQILLLKEKNPQYVVEPELRLLAKDLLPLLSRKSGMSSSLGTPVLYLAILTHQDRESSLELYEELTKLTKDANRIYLDSRKNLATVPSNYNFGFSDQASKLLFLKSLTQDPVVSQHLFVDYRSFGKIFENLGFDKETLSQWSLQLPDDFPRRAEILLGAATTITNFGEGPEFAIPIFETALAQANKDKDEEFIKVVQICHVATLRKTKNLKKALQIIDSLTLTELPDSEQRRYKYLFEWAEQEKVATD